MRASAYRAIILEGLKREKQTGDIKLVDLKTKNVDAQKPTTNIRNEEVNDIGFIELKQKAVKASAKSVIGLNERLASDD